MAHTKPRSMKVTRTKVRNVISRIEANDAFVFLSRPHKTQVYLNLGGHTFYLTAGTPITITQEKAK